MIVRQSILDTTVFTINSFAASTSFAVTITGASARPTSPASPARRSSDLINVTFTPTASGARTGTLSLTDNAGGSPQIMTLSGNGTAPGVGFPPTSPGFGNQPLATTSAPMTVTLTNTGTSALTINSFAASDDSTPIHTRHDRFYYQLLCCFHLFCRNHHWCKCPPHEPGFSCTSLFRSHQRDLYADGLGCADRNAVAYRQCRRQSADHDAQRKRHGSRRGIGSHESRLWQPAARDHQRADDRNADKYRHGRFDDQLVCGFRRFRSEERRVG